MPLRVKLARRSQSGSRSYPALPFKGWNRWRTRSFDSLRLLRTSAAGSTPARRLKFVPCTAIQRLESLAHEVLRLSAFAQDFACGLRRPQDGSSSSPSLPTNQSQEHRGPDRGCAARHPRTMTIAPAVIRRPPMSDPVPSFSPSSNHAKSMTRGTLSLSRGATRDAGPSCRARK